MKSASKTKPIRSDEEVKQNNDMHIDQDFPGYPHHPSSRKMINPKKRRNKIEAGVIKPAKRS